MPIDYLAQKKKAEGDVDALLAGRKGQIGDELTRTRNSIAARRNDFLSTALPSAIAKTGGPAIAPDVSRGVGQLNRATNRTLLQSQRTGHQTRLNLLYDQAIEMATRYGKSRRDAEDFARRYLAQKMEQEFQAGEAEKDRQAQLKRSDMADNATKAGLDLQDQYQGSSNPSIWGGIAGLAGTLGTAYLLNKGMAKDPVSTGNTVQPTANYSGTGKTYKDIYGDALMREKFAKDYLKDYGTRGRVSFGGVI